VSRILREHVATHLRLADTVRLFALRELACGLLIGIAQCTVRALLQARTSRSQISLGLLELAPCRVRATAAYECLDVLRLAVQALRLLVWHNDRQRTMEQWRSTLSQLCNSTYTAAEL
jgi:hypothetical protein